MKEDILIKARILSKEWQIKKCEKTVRYITKAISERLTEISLIGDDLSEKGEEAHYRLISFILQIDEQDRLMDDLNQDMLLILNNADGYCCCDSCVTNKEYLRGSQKTSRCSYEK